MRNAQGQVNRAAHERRKAGADLASRESVAGLGVGASCSRMTRLGRKGSLPIPKTQARHVAIASVHVDRGRR